MVKTYQTKPVKKQAIQWTGTNHAEVYAFVPKHLRNEEPDGLHILTLEGDHLASVGDYIVKGLKGEFYPCKPDVFGMTYDEVEEEAE